MNRSIEIEDALDDLEEDLQLWLRDLAPDMPEVAAAALDRMAIRPGRPRLWTRRLSPIVVLYPSFQTAAVSTPVDLRESKRLALAHLQLLIYAFLGDRQVDGQLRLTPEENVLCVQALLCGLDAVARRTPPEDSGTVGNLFRRYHRAQLARYPAVRDTPADLFDRRVFRIVADRAIPGWLAARSLLRCAAPATRRRAKIAFDHLAVGLQWTDDLVDWEHDLECGQGNLLLRRLDSGHGEELESETSQIESQLIAHGVYDLAFQRIALHLRRAAALQRELGCQQIAEGCERILVEMEGIEEHLRQLVQDAAVPSSAEHSPSPHARRSTSPLDH